MRKGFFPIKGLILLVAFLVLFGGAFYDLTTTSARCGLSFTEVGKENNYTCNEMIITFGKTVVVPDQNIGKGVQGILSMRALGPEVLDQIGVLADIQEQQFIYQIIIGFVGFLVLFGLLAFIFIKISPSSGIDAGSLGVSLIAAFLLISLLMVMFDESAEPGFFGIEGAKTPFRGIRLLLSNPDVLFSVVDETALLPGTLTTEEIIAKNT